MGTNIGFIGTGVITSALVTGFCSKGDLDHRIYLSPRNEERAKALAERFKNVFVAKSNQEVLDKSEWVVLAVLPQLGEDIIRPLSFRQEHRVINLMSDRKLSEIAGWIGKTRTLVQMVPLPFAAKRIGPIAIYPHDREVANLFKPLGEIIGVDEVKQIEALAAITALMSSYYTLLWEVVKWGENEGLSRKEAADYTTAFFEALSSQARHEEEGNLERLAREMTPGGLNEMALLSIREQDGFAPWVRALDPVLKRLRRTV
ncbi:MAG: pyrroline-5-carboxylate reductase [Bacillota bacterium]|jgi:pyrroline-5-carboxylate reductase|nr:NAD(P)-binding domain-containing protein [Clostridia bacterium]